ncbi:hypothetical protein L7F22_004593 [Adiantum nelumboides]|nr:hypothetical protein [Adiantum nelumboides]
MSSNQFDRIHQHVIGSRSSNVSSDWNQYRRSNFPFPTFSSSLYSSWRFESYFGYRFHQTSILLLLAVFLCIKTVLNEDLNGLSALQFGVLHTLGNLGLVIMDSSYWQKAYSADISAAVPGYILGSILYFGIPFSLGTVLGLGGVALQNSPEWHLSNLEELSADLLPFLKPLRLHQGGAAAAALIVFLTCTSTISAQLVAVSSILSLDVYRTYLYKKATDKQTIAISRWACLGFGVFASGFAVFFYEVGLDLTWTLYFLGIITVSL